MQLPATDELVLVSGCPPIRARKARYYEDRQLTERLLPPPEPERPRASSVTMDDWSAKAVRPVPTASGERTGGLQDGQPVDDPANGGIRREPELAEHEDIAPEPNAPSPEFEFAEDEADDDAARARRLRATARGLARQAAMDPGDGIDL